MKKKFIFLLFSLIVLIVISGCGLSNRKSQTLDILQNQVCAPPCWQGITPGTTTFDEAWTIAQNLMMSENSFHNQLPISVDDGKFNDYISINYKYMGIGLNPDSQGTINEILFLFDRRYWVKPELQDLIEIYGNPISVEMCHESIGSRRAIVWIRYPDVSFSYDQKLPAEGDSFTVHVKMDTEIEYILYKLPGAEFPALDFSFPWSGYGDLTIRPAEKNPLSTCP